MKWFLGLWLGFFLSTQSEAHLLKECQHLFGKMGEFAYLKPERAHEGLLRADILISTEEKKIIKVKVGDISPIHKITFPPAIEKTNHRAEKLKGAFRNPPSEISFNDLNQILPSKNAIRVIKDGRGKYVVFDGNGRLEALKKAFGTEVEIEVELFDTDSRGVISLMNRVRRGQGTLPKELTKKSL